MNRKLNTAFFIVGATVLNILLMLVLMGIGLFLVTLIFGSSINETGASIAFLIVFVGSIGGAFFVYHRIVRLISKKIDMDKYFHPIFGRRR